jgi:hypothetical protein
MPKMSRRSLLMLSLLGFVPNVSLAQADPKNTLHEQQLDAHYRRLEALRQDVARCTPNMPIAPAGPGINPPGTSAPGSSKECKVALDRYHEESAYGYRLRSQGGTK